MTYWLLEWWHWFQIFILKHEAPCSIFACYSYILDRMLVNHALSLNFCHVDIKSSYCYSTSSSTCQYRYCGDHWESWVKWTHGLVCFPESRRRLLYFCDINCTQNISGYSFFYLFNKQIIVLIFQQSSSFSSCCRYCWSCWRSSWRQGENIQFVLQKNSKPFME